MKVCRSRLSTAFVTAAVAIGVLAAPAAAWYCPPTGQNQGGDEGGPIQGGTGAP